ncbi:hypothetical protein [Azospirillum sp. TSO5]|uniref:hypothetical protein n=1 Tax=Azospirillum sp. TSO5 TaxID=716760 RepID=UPI000D61F586|nr:hypothetical protein [Azospirillum sp. TSO5]PWC83690.1 hypothetical protein TSO5_29050 [Azospirillum sp. TSO5]
MTLNGVYSRFERATPAILGERINPHLLRHCAATSIALDDPQGARLTVALLGQLSDSTAARWKHWRRPSLAARTAPRRWRGCGL